MQASTSGMKAFATGSYRIGWPVGLQHHRGRPRLAHSRKLSVAATAAAQAAPFPRPGAQVLPWQTVVATTATTLLLCNIHRSTFTTLLPFVTEHHALSMTQVGWVQSAMLMGYLVGQFPAGWAADKFGGERVLLAGLLLWSLSLGSTAFATDLPLLLASRACMGLFSACMMPCVSSMAAAWVPQQVKAATVASVYMFFNLGGVVGLVGVPGLALQLGWQQALVAVAAGGVLWACIGWSTLPNRPVEHFKPRVSTAAHKSVPAAQPVAGVHSSATSHSTEHSQNGVHQASLIQTADGQEGRSNRVVSGQVALVDKESASEQIGGNGTGVGLHGAVAAASMNGVGHAPPASHVSDRIQTEPAAVKAVGGGVKVTQVLALCWAHAVIGWGFFIFQSWIPMYLKSLGAASLSTTGLLASLPWLAAGLLGTVTGRTADTLVQKGWARLTVRRAMHAVSTLGCAACVVPLYCLGAVDPLVAAGWLTAFNCCYAASFGGFHAYIQDVAGSHAGKLTGLTNSCGIVLGIMGNLLTGQLLEASGTYASVFMITAILYITSFLSFFHLDGKPYEAAA